MTLKDLVALAHDEHRALVSEENVPRPHLFPDVSISRQYRFHLLYLPGEAEPSYHRELHTALAVLQSGNYSELTIVMPHDYLDVRIVYEE